MSLHDISIASSRQSRAVSRHWDKTRDTFQQTWATSNNSLIIFISMSCLHTHSHTLLISHNMTKTEGKVWVLGFSGGLCINIVCLLMLKHWQILICAGNEVMIHKNYVKEKYLVSTERVLMKFLENCFNILVQAIIRKYLMESNIFLSGKSDKVKFNVFRTKIMLKYLCINQPREKTAK